MPLAYPAAKALNAGYGRPLPRAKSKAVAIRQLCKRRTAAAGKGSVRLTCAGRAASCSMNSGLYWAAVTASCVMWPRPRGMEMAALTLERISVQMGCATPSVSSTSPS